MIMVIRAVAQVELALNEKKNPLGLSQQLTAMLDTMFKVKLEVMGLGGTCGETLTRRYDPSKEHPGGMVQLITVLRITQEKHGDFRNKWRKRKQISLELIRREA